MRFDPTHRHVKSGRLYRELRRGVLEADMTPVVIYDDAEGRTCWVRPAAEFDDGRFVRLTGDEK